MATFRLRTGNDRIRLNRREVDTVIVESASRRDTNIVLGFESQDLIDLSAFGDIDAQELIGNGIQRGRRGVILQGDFGRLGLGGITKDQLRPSNFITEEDPKTQNLPPIAVDDTVATEESTPVIIPVLSNDIDEDGDPISITRVATPRNGTASISDGLVRYTPDAGFAGTDRFTYTISDGNGGTDAATVQVTVREREDVSSTRNLGTLRGRSQYTDSVGSGNTSDNYRFNLDSSGRLEFAIRELSANADMELLNSSNQVIASSVNGGTLEEFASIDNLSPGNYTVRVYSASGDTDYELTLNLDQAGNSLANARDLGTLTDRSELGDYEFRDFVGRLLGDEVDYYRFQLDRDRLFTFALREMSADADVYLEDANGNVLQSSRLGGSADEIADANLAANTTYYIRVDPFNDDSTNYLLVLNPGEEESQEPPDNDEIQNLGTLTGRSQYTDFVGSGNTSDYYRFNLDAPGRLEFAIRELSADADMELLNSSNQVLISSVNGGTLEEFASIDNLSPGNYTVRVYSASGDTDYELTLNLDKAGNSRANARDLGTLTDRSEFGDYEFRDFVGRLLGDEVDYYRFRLDRSRLFTFALRELSADADVYLEDANGNVLQSSRLGGSADEIADANLAANTTYYIRVEPFSDSSTNYQLVLNPREEANSSFSFQLDNQAVTQNATTYVPVTNTSVLAGTSDDDTLIGGAGAGVINGRGGDDLIGISDRSFDQISGGSGEDTLRLDGTFNLDLTAIDDTRIQGIEILDLNGGGNSLTLEVRDLQNISDSENSLTVLGTAGNAVNANLPGFSTNSADGFTTYTDGTSSLVVDDNLIQNVLT